MADEKKAFSELLSDAPLATTENAISVVGALARSHHPGKFVLLLAGGMSVTLDIDAVKDYRVIAGAVAQLLVEVVLDSNKVPRELKESQAGQGGEWGYGPGYYGGQPVAPFALATPHQVPANVLAAADAFRFTPFGWPTIYWYDNTAAGSDVHHTIPRIDSGATGVAPYWD
jgi:hypothetical protein